MSSDYEADHQTTEMDRLPDSNRRLDLFIDSLDSIVASSAIDFCEAALWAASAKRDSLAK
jgi:hypothetical protein